MTPRFTRRALVLGATAVATVGCSVDWSRRAGRTRAADPDRSGASDPATDDDQGPKKWLALLTDTFEGRTRHSWLFTPREGGKAPLVMCLHGHGGNAAAMYARYGWLDTCRKNGWYGLFPESGEGETDDLYGGDHAYLAAVARRALAEHSADPARVYAVGFSGGGYRAYQLAARHSDLFAAIAVSSGKPGDVWDDHPQDWNPAYQQARPVSIFHVHGLKDDTIPFAGGPYKDGRIAVPVREGLDAWAAWDQATPVANPTPPATLPRGATFERWEAPTGHAVALAIDPAQAHEWPDWANDPFAAFLAASPPRS